MERKSGITISKGNLSYVLHNLRLKQTKNSIFDKSNNIYMNDYETAIKIYTDELQKRSLAYTKRTGKKLQKRTFTHMTAIVNLDEHNCTKEYIEKLIKFLEKRYDTKVFNYAIHLDEGYEDDAGRHINYHAHIEFMGIDSTGQSIRRKLDKFELRKLQTEVAKLLDMQRGIFYDKNNRKKRLPTYKYKEHAKRQAVELKPVLKENRKLKEENTELKEKLAKVKDLDEESKKIRELFKELGAKREDYADIEQLKRILRERIKKEKDLTKQEIERIYKQKEAEFRQKLQGLEEENNQLKNKNQGLQAKLDEVNKQLDEALRYAKELEENLREINSDLEIEEEFFPIDDYNVYCDYNPKSKINRKLKM